MRLLAVVLSLFAGILIASAAIPEGTYVCMCVLKAAVYVCANVNTFVCRIACTHLYSMEVVIIHTYTIIMLENQSSVVG